MVEWVLEAEPVEVAAAARLCRAHQPSAVVGKVWVVVIQVELGAGA